jgi:translation initiation factor 2 subunit 2
MYYENTVLTIVDKIADKIEDKIEVKIEDKIVDKSVTHDLDEELVNIFDLGKKKRKTKEKKVIVEQVVLQPNVPLYTYQELLYKLYDKMGNSTDLSNTPTKFKLAPPIVVKITSKKVLWANFNDTCLALNREHEHLFLYITTELNTEASINQNKQMIIKGKYYSKNIENILRKYIYSYVQCSMCHSYETEITKDNSTRLHYLACLLCKSFKTIPVIKKTKLLNN